MIHPPIMNRATNQSASSRVPTVPRIQPAKAYKNPTTRPNKPPIRAERESLKKASIPSTKDRTIYAPGESSTRFFTYPTARKKRTIAAPQKRQKPAKIPMFVVGAAAPFEKEQ